MRVTSAELQELLFYYINATFSSYEVVQLLLLFFHFLGLYLADASRLLVIDNLQAIGKFAVAHLLTLDYILDTVADFVQPLSLECGLVVHGLWSAGARAPSMPFVI